MSSFEQAEDRYYSRLEAKAEQDLWGEVDDPDEQLSGEELEATEAAIFNQLKIDAFDVIVNTTHSRYDTLNWMFYSLLTSSPEDLEFHRDSLLELMKSETLDYIRRL